MRPQFSTTDKLAADSSVLIALEELKNAVWAEWDWLESIEARLHALGVLSATVTLPHIPSLDDRYVNVTGDTMTGGLTIVRPTDTDDTLSVKVNGDTQPRLSVDAGGTMGWGAGTAWPDTLLYRLSASTLALSDSLKVGSRLAVGTSLDANYTVRVAAGATAAVQLTDTSGTALGGLLFGTDVTLYRSGTDTLKTDDAMFVANRMGVGTLPTTNALRVYSPSEGSGTAYEVAKFRKNHSPNYGDTRITLGDTSWDSTPAVWGVNSLSSGPFSFGTFGDVFFGTTYDASDFGKILFLTKNTVRGVIAATGEWGIGTTFTAGASLRVPAGSAVALHLSDTGGTAAGGIQFGSDVNIWRGAADVLYIGDNIRVNPANPYLEWGGNTLTMRTYSTGIGVLRLEKNPSSTFAPRMDITDAAGNVVIRYDGGGVGYYTSGSFGVKTTTPNTLQGFTFSTPVVTLDNGTGRADINVRGNPANLNVVNAAGAADTKWIQFNVQSTGIARFRSLNDANTAAVKDNIITMSLSTGEVGLSSTPTSGMMLTVPAGSTAAIYLSSTSGTAVGGIRFAETSFYRLAAGSLLMNANLELDTAVTITGSTADGYAASFISDPAYTAASAQTVTRHNYLDLQNVALTNVTVTDAAIARFDANAGTHKAVDAGTTKASPGTVNAWLKWNINGTIYYTPAYTSKTS